MNRKLNAALVIMLIVPALFMIWLGLRSVRIEQERFHSRLRDSALQRLRDRDETLSAAMDTVMRSVLEPLSRIQRNTDPEYMRGLARSQRFIRQVFVWNMDSGLIYPDPESRALTENERLFLTRSSALWSVGEPFVVKKEGETSARDSGWHVWFLEEGTHFIVWRSMPDGGITGAELDRFAVLAELVSILPHTAVKHGSRDRAVDERIVLNGPLGDTLYQWGSYSPALDQTRFAEFNLSHPLSAWTLALYTPAPASGGITPAGLSLIMAAISVVIVMTLAVIYIKREHSRAMRDARQRVSFVNQVSHELKTPLTNISMYAELLKKHIPEDDEKAVKFMDVVASESRRLGRMINNVLTFARNQRGTVRLFRAPGVVDETIRDTLDHFTPVFARKNMSLSVNGGCHQTVLFDRDVIEQILCNLLGNAEKYAGEGALVTVSSAVRGAVIEITVADNGPGIPKSRRDDVFKPFVRLDDRLTEGAAGAGIGLSIARDLARLHGGDLTIEPSDTGACFKLSFAVGKAEEEPGIQL